MAVSHAVAVAEIFGQFKTAWDADAPAIAGTVAAPPVLTEDTEQPGAIPTISDPTNGTRVLAQDEAYARYRARHLGGNNAAIGRKLFYRWGQLTIQVFAPRRGGVGKAKALALAQLVQNAYESTSARNVNFTNVSLREVGASGPWYQVNVSADFNWYERKT